MALVHHHYGSGSFIVTLVKTGGRVGGGEWGGGGASGGGGEWGGRVGGGRVKCNIHRCHHEYLLAIGIIIMYINLNNNVFILVFRLLKES